MIFGKINPYWDIDYFKNLKYKKNPDPILCEEYSNCGHNIESLTIYNCIEPNFLDFDKSKILKHFKDLKHPAFAVNLFKPGQYIPIHVDRYERYKTLYSANKILRVIIMLEDSEPGQILQIDKDIVGTWNSGDWFAWENEEPHAFYNMSKKDRYALQLTGTIC